MNSFLTKRFYYYRSIDLSKPFEVDFNEWQFFDLRFGIPLFNRELNASILNIFMEKKLGSHENLIRMQQANRKLTLNVIEFIQSNQQVTIYDKEFFENTNQKDELYLITNLTNKNKKSSQPSILIKPTQCILFNENKIHLINET